MSILKGDYTPRSEEGKQAKANYDRMIAQSEAQRLARAYRSYTPEQLLLIAEALIAEAKARRNS